MPGFINTYIGEQEFLSSDCVRQMLGYSNRSSFWQAVRQCGLPYTRINSRRCIFPAAAVRAWLESRTVGSLPPNNFAAHQLRSTAFEEAHGGSTSEAEQPKAY